MQETWVQSCVGKIPLKEEMATHSSSLAWRIPWTEEPGRLQSMGLKSRTRLKQLNNNFRNTLLCFFLIMKFPMVGKNAIATKKFGEG